MDQDGGSVVVELAATAGRRVDGVLGGSDSTDQLGRSFCVCVEEYLKQVGPVEKVEPFDETGGAVSHDGGSSQVLGRNG